MVENHVSPTSGGRRKEKMVENHVSPTSRWEEEGQMVENHVISTSGLQVGRKKWLKIMLLQHLAGR